MAEPLRHRQTKEAATDMFSLQPPRHISTLHFSTDTQQREATQVQGGIEPGSRTKVESTALLIRTRCAFPVL